MQTGNEEIELEQPLFLVAEELLVVGEKSSELLSVLSGAV